MPMDFMLKRQRDELAAAIVQRGLQPTDFDDGYWSGDHVGFSNFLDAYAVVCAADRRYWFAIQEDGLAFKILIRPGRESREETANHLTWHQVRAMYGHWLEALKHELELPDLWSELAARHSVTRAIAALDNTPFSVEEQRHLQQQLDRVLAAARLTEAQAEVVSADLNYLKEAATRSGRRDWTLLVLGTVAGWALSSVLPPDKVSEVWQHVLPILQAAGLLGSHLLRP